MEEKMVEMELCNGGEKIPVRITNKIGSIYIEPQGYGDFCSEDGKGTPIVLEMFHGKLKIHVWTDINDEDTTHSIDLTGALEKNRKKY